MDIRLRKATESDRKEISEIIAHAFQFDFSPLCKDPHVVAEAIRSALQIDRFFVALAKDQMVGVVALSDRLGRAFKTNCTSYTAYFGLVRGWFAHAVFKDEFETPFDISSSTGYIEFVAVKKGYQRRGIATRMLDQLLKIGGYDPYILDVSDHNHAALHCYQKLGFKEYARKKVSFSFFRGYHSKILMRCHAMVKTDEEMNR